jgi:hypothetical protein
MDEQIQNTSQKKQGIDPIAVGAGVATGGVAAWGGVEIVNNAVKRHYNTLLTDYAPLSKQYISRIC